MKPVTVSSNAKTLNALLKKARRRDVILESAEGERFVLSSMARWQSFEVGDSDDFAVEVQRTAQHKRLAKVMTERRVKDQSKPRLSIEKVRQELGLE
jgi:hypothetical protein